MAKCTYYLMSNKFFICRNRLFKETFKSGKTKSLMAIIGSKSNIIGSKSNTCLTLYQYPRNRLLLASI